MAASDDATTLWQMADLVTPMAIRVAATLRLPDALAAGPRTAEELAAEVAADSDALQRLLRHLATKGLFERDESGRFSLASRGDALRDGHPSSMRRMLDLEGAIGRADLSFVQLLHSVRTAEAGYPLQFEAPFWEDMRAEPTRSALYDEQMGADIAADAAAVVAGFDWGSLGHVVDVGGGSGALLIALLRAFPTLRGTVFDQPATAERARLALEEAGLADRGDAAGGNFFEAVPAGADGYILSAILHDWADSQALAILGASRKAAAPGGRVFVIEKFAADGSIRTAMDLRMLVYFGGKERTVAELSALAAEAGLQTAAVHPAGALAIIEFLVS